jgi:hypothetical protein
MLSLNFPKYNLRIKSSENKTWVFDIIRKKYVLLQPEEWVRQHMVHYLLETKKYPTSLINTEKQLIVNNLKKRYDIVVYNSNGSIHILVECKAPSIKITQQAFDQIAQYNMQLNATFLIVSNGLEHYFCKMDYQNKKYIFLNEIPDFKR